MKQKVLDSLRSQGYSAKDAATAVDAVTDAIVNVLIENGEVRLQGFGVFSVKLRSARTTKNPRTGEMMHITARNTLHFKPSKKIKL